MFVVFSIYAYLVLDLHDLRGCLVNDRGIGKGMHMIDESNETYSSLK